MEGKDVNVDEGFLHGFPDEFLEHYGRESMFARTLSDWLTDGLARLLKANGRLSESDPVAQYSSEAAVEILSEWIKSVEGAKQMALQESMGWEPIGSLEALVDKKLGEGRFQQWLNHLESLNG